jgi:hypothetical protein
MKKESAVLDQLAILFKGLEAAQLQRAELDEKIEHMKRDIFSVLNHSGSDSTVSRGVSRDGMVTYSDSNPRPQRYRQGSSDHEHLYRSHGYIAIADRYGIGTVERNSGPGGISVVWLTHEEAQHIYRESSRMRQAAK